MQKTFITNTSIAVVYQKNYCKSLTKIQTITSELKADYPELTDDEIEIDFFTGHRLERVIHAYAKVKRPAENYAQVSDRSYFF